MKRNRERRAGVAAAVTCFALAAGAGADVLNVPGDYDTIQEAIDAASTGDEIIVGAGEYHEALELRKALTLRSSGGSTVTVLDGDDTRRILMCDSIEESGTLIEGFTFARGWKSDAGAAVFGNHCTGTVSIRNCVFLDNTAGQYGGAIQFSNSNFDIDSCRFERNVANGLSGGAIHLWTNSHLNITRSQFIDNGEGATGGNGVTVSANASARIEQCKFYRNSGNMGGAIIAWDSTGTSISNSLFVDNSASIGGGAIRTRNSQLACVNCTFVGNSAGAYGGVVFAEGGNAELINSTVWENQPSALAGDATASYCNADEALSGDGNISADPLFIDATGPDGTPGTGDEDLRLSQGSPCIDAGSNPGTLPDTLFDLDGNARFVDDPRTDDTGLGDPPLVDIGAYEFQAVYDPCWQADFSGDGQVNQADLGILLAWYGIGDGGDTDGDGDTDQADLGALLGVYGEACD